MMRHLRFRSGAAFLAVLYLALPGGVLGVRACPHHDGAVAEHGAAASGAVAAHSDIAINGDASVDAHGAASIPGRDPAAGPAHFDHGAVPDGHGEDEVCSCLGACATSASIVLDAAVPASPDPVYGATRIASFSAPETPRATRPPHFLPYPQAPPSLPV